MTYVTADDATEYDTMPQCPLTVFCAVSPAASYKVFPAVSLAVFLQMSLPAHLVPHTMLVDCVLC